MLDHATFEDVYQAYSADVYRFCLFMLRDHSAAQDAASDAFIAAYRAYERSQPIADVRLWLLRIARNTAIDQRRSSARLRHLFGRLVERDDSPAPCAEELALLTVEMREVIEAMEVLRPKHRMLISLRFSSDLSYEQISTLTGMSAKAAAKVTRRAVARLRAEVEKRR